MVFTGRTFERERVLQSADSAEPCCVFGTYGNGKTLLMQEAERVLKENYPRVIPAYTRYQRTDSFEKACFRALQACLRDRGINTDFDETSPDMESIRRLAKIAERRNLSPYLFIDDTDRYQEVADVEAAIHTIRELRDLGCGLCVPSNPNNATHFFATKAQGIVDAIRLSQLTELHYIEMAGKYLQTARRGVEPVKVCLVYAKPDAEMVRKLYSDIESLGYDSWMAEFDLLPGESWAPAIEESLRKAAFVVICLSNKSYERRGFYQKEIQLALDLVERMLPSDIFLIPVRLEPCDLPVGLGKYQAIDWFDGFDLSRLDRSFREGMKRRRAAMDVETKSGSLRPFTEDAIATVVQRVGEGLLTPRMFNTACGTFLNLASQQAATDIDLSFINNNWSTVGAQILSSNEGEIETCLRVVKELMANDGRIDEDTLDLASLIEMLNEPSPIFEELVARLDDFKDVFQVTDEGANRVVTLSPLIDRQFVSDVFLQKKPNEFLEIYKSEWNDSERSKEPPGNSVMLEVRV